MQATLNLDDINMELAAAAEAAREPALPREADVHPFRRVGLGKAPFRCVGCDIDETRCQFCTTPIKYAYRITGADGSRFTVGSECVKQTGGAVEGFATFNRQMEARVRKLQADARKARETSKVRTEAEAWKEAHATEFTYMQARAAAGNGFYSYLLSVVERFGSIYDSKLESVRADIRRDVGRTAAQAPRAAAPVVNLEPVQAAFARAAVAGVSRPTLRLGGFVFNLAPATGNNPGAIYVKERMPAGELPGRYLGKVLGGKFFASRECDAAAQSEVVAVSQDPAAAAIAYGRKFGKCSICNRDLSDAASVERGIGPICAEKYGF